MNKKQKTIEWAERKVRDIVYKMKFGTKEQKKKAKRDGERFMKMMGM